MHKSVSISLWIVAIILVLAGFVIGNYYSDTQAEMKKMYTNDTREIAKGIYVVKDDFVNLFFVKDSNQYIAIDAGNSAENIRREIKKLRIDSAKVCAVLLTHSDDDHVGSLCMFPNAKVFIPADEEQMINGNTSRNYFTHNKITALSYTLLKDGQDLNIGKTRIRCISTPGHTPGSMSYQVNDSLLFTGDAFGLRKGKITRPSDVFTMDMETAILSFKKISSLPKVQYLFTSHSGFSCEYKNAVDTVF